MEMDPGTLGGEPGAPAADTRTIAGACSDGSDGGDESEPPNSRAAMHADTSRQNNYFVLTDNRITEREDEGEKSLERRFL